MKKSIKMIGMDKDSQHISIKIIFY